ncbi:MAG: hypothetical protein WBN97_05325 [Parvibaculum sp.]
MRMILGLIVLALIAVVIAPVVYYRTTDACRMLSQEMALEAYQPMAELLGTDPKDVPDAVERSMRLITSQYDTGTCLGKLKDIWLGQTPTAESEPAS